MTLPHRMFPSCGASCFRTVAGRFRTPARGRTVRPAMRRLTRALRSAPPHPGKKHWLCRQVQSGREESIKEAIERRVKIEGLEEFFGQVVVPIERETRDDSIGQAERASKRSRRRRNSPAIIMAEVEYNDKILLFVRETSGAGDFVGGSAHSRAPCRCPNLEVHAMLRDQDDVENREIDESARKPKVAMPTKLPFSAGDKVRVCATAHSKGSKGTGRKQSRSRRTRRTAIRHHREA